ncbi:hydroxyacylglutathione hydrolase [Intestinirhabdus alba]|jgi:hydroxyacylglutathione hydrolase|uniref:Hydroxyacylglutathione hydrolase n=1 Tax=Intestinirhabdus alba TaxID=2899544 RepID=A0A6L6IRB8_9ENTR|nr:hydroxyacylglutathione hydrolase [Intestinirhabdus alba]MTH48268.1 hydroxyacylglutathione hydrolase [Intestinirhabdus alba]
MNLNSIPAFQDNYIWVLSNSEGRCLIVDPGDAGPILAAVAKQKWRPEAIFLTHHHQDHVGGVKELLQHFPKMAVYGPAETLHKGVSHIVKDGDFVTVLGQQFTVIATPGHTAGHLCYFSHPYLFCGDTLFSGGCGRLFEGTPAQMYQSLKKISALPDDTLICCAHEYTLTNLTFAKSILPHDSFINDYYREVKELRLKNQMTLPVILKNERHNNIFLRTEDPVLIKEINKETLLQQPEQRFAWLRSKKDSFS